MTSGSPADSNADMPRPLTARLTDEPPYQTDCAPNDSEDSAADLKLVRRLLARDDRAWQTFVQEYHRVVFRGVYAAIAELQLPNVGNDLIEDVCADVFSGLLQRDMSSLRAFAGRSRLSTWLFVVARRMALRVLVKSQKQERQADSAEMTMLPTQEAGTDQSRRREKLRQAMRQLSPADQEVLALFYDQQSSYRDIAATLQISPNAVGPKLDRARRRLRQVLQDNPTPFDEFEFITTPSEGS